MNLESVSLLIAVSTQLGNNSNQLIMVILCIKAVTFHNFFVYAHSQYTHTCKYSNDLFTTVCLEFIPPEEEHISQRVVITIIYTVHTSLPARIPHVSMFRRVLDDAMSWNVLPVSEGMYTAL